MIWLGFLIGLVVGANIGLLAASLLFATAKPFDRCDDPDCPLYDGEVGL